MNISKTKAAPRRLKFASLQKLRAKFLPAPPTDAHRAASLGTVADGRRAERARLKAIYALPGAAEHVELVNDLAFDSDSSVAQVEAVLAAARLGDMARRSADRAARNPKVSAGDPIDAPAGAVVSARWDRAFKTAANPIPTPRKD